MSDRLPKVLLFTSEIPQSINAGSMQLYRVLQGYPADRLLVLGVAPEPNARLLPCRYETIRLLTYRLVCTRFSSWVTGLNSLNLLPELGLAGSLRKVGDFRPDLVVTVMDKLSYYKHAWALARRLRVPLFTITMDDPQQFERSHPWFETAFVQMLRRIYAHTTLSLGVSQEMCDYLAAHFGKPSTVFHFGPPDCMRPRRPELSRTLKSSPYLTLGYAGSMSLGYREGILALLGVLEATGTRLNVYTKEQHFLIEHPLVTNRGFLPAEALWATVQAECDAVLLPYAFTGEIQRVYRTHFPTKLSEYCWVGMPMLLTGPPDATGIRWGLRHPEAAMTATSPDPQCIGPLLERLCADASLRAALAHGAERVARAEFDPGLIRQRFVALLRQAAAGAAVPAT